jgi:hypothetical protein
VNDNKKKQPLPPVEEEPPIFTPVEEIVKTGPLIDPVQRSRATIKPIMRYNPLKDIKVIFSILSYF